MYIELGLRPVCVVFASLKLPCSLGVGTISVALPPTGPCTQIVYILALNYLLPKKVHWGQSTSWTLRVPHLHFPAICPKWE